MMFKYFYNLYQTKSQGELEAIVAEHGEHHLDAVKASIKLLDEKFNVKVRGIDLRKGENDLPQWMLDIWVIVKRRSPRLSNTYFKTLSYRELISGISLGALFVAFLSVLSLFPEGYWGKGISVGLYFLGLLAVVITGHIMYKKEHRRRNQVLGRFIQTSLTTVMAFLFLQLWGWLNNGEFDFSDFHLIILALGFVVLIMETVASLLRRFLTLFGWLIW